MDSPFIAHTVVFGFTAVLICCLQLLGGGADTMTTNQAQASSQSSGLAPRLAAAALVPAALITLTLTQLLMFAHLNARELVRARAAGNGGGGAVSRLVAGLARATLLAVTLALLAGAVVQIGADGHLDRGRGDVARLNIK